MDNRKVLEGLIKNRYEPSSDVGDLTDIELGLILAQSRLAALAAIDKQKGKPGVLPERQRDFLKSRLNEFHCLAEVNKRLGNFDEVERIFNEMINIEEILQ